VTGVQTCALPISFFFQRFLYSVKETGTYYRTAAVMKKDSASPKFLHIFSRFILRIFSKHKICRSVECKIVHNINPFFLFRHVFLLILSLKYIVLHLHLSEKQKKDPGAYSRTGSFSLILCCHSQAVPNLFGPVNYFSTGTF